MDKYINRRQICKYQNSKALMEFNDKLNAAETDKAANIHSSFSKINVVAKDYSQGTGEKAINVSLNLDPETVKYIANEILQGNTTFNFSEQKVLRHKTNKDGKVMTTRLGIKYNAQMRLAWNFILDTGWGEAEQTEIGGVSLKKGTYVSEGQVKLFLADIEAKKLMITINDYIRAWEILALRKLLQSRDATEKTERTDKPDKPEHDAQSQFTFY